MAALMAAAGLPVLEIHSRKSQVGTCAPDRQGWQQGAAPVAARDTRLVGAWC